MDSQIDKKHWDKIEKLFLEAANIEPQLLQSWLKKQTREESPVILETVAKMLAGISNISMSLSTPIKNSLALLAQDKLNQSNKNTFLDDSNQSLLGNYRLIKELGKGGMSSVYLASRADLSFHQEVAIKIVHHWLNDDSHHQRFIAERQMLAQLNHPNIAKLIDGGTTPSGSPYFVMEVIEGEPIDRYCNQNKLSIAERIRLFQKVCSAVEFAHRNLIVHRDIKPSNILVTADGIPKLLDFGIAKLIDPTVISDTTKTIRRMGTPGYTSPEQINGETITTATDVYGLGLLLYKLLTEELPDFYSGVVRNNQSNNKDSEPRRLADISKHISKEVAEERNETTKSLQRILAGDLDNIALKAIRQTPERRYCSVANFSADLSRYLNGHPVKARPDSYLYRIGKFIRRHRLGVASLVSIFIVSILFIFTLIEMESNSAKQRDKAEQVSKMLVNLFEMAGSKAAKENKLHARSLLDQGREQLDLLTGQDEAQIMLRETLASLYEKLGQFQSARELYQLSLKQKLTVQSATTTSAIESLYNLARVTALSGDLISAEPLFRQTLNLRRSSLGEDHPDVAKSLNSLALVLHEQGKYEAAYPLYQQALLSSLKLNGNSARQTLKTRGNLALLLFDQGKYLTAEQIYAEALVNGHTPPKQSNLLADVIDGLAQTKLILGDIQAAEDLAKEALEIRRNLLGLEHPDIARSLAHLAAIYSHQNLTYAVQLAEQALTQRRDSYGVNNAETGESLSILAAIRIKQGKHSDARQLYQQAIQSYRVSLSNNHPMAARPVAEFAIYLAQQGECQQAIPLLEVAVKDLPDKDWRMSQVRKNISQCRNLAQSSSKS